MELSDLQGVECTQTSVSSENYWIGQGNCSVTGDNRSWTLPASFEINFVRVLIDSVLGSGIEFGTGESSVDGGKEEVGEGRDRDHTMTTITVTVWFTFIHVWSWRMVTKCHTRIPTSHNQRRRRYVWCVNHSHQSSMRSRRDSTCHN